MKSILQIHLISHLTFIIIILNIVGCAHSHVIQTNDLSSNDNKIIVYTNDRKTVQFMESEYRIDTSNVTRTINGEGLVLKDSIGYMNKRFSGSISFSKIDSIQVSEHSPLSNVVGLGIVIVGSATVILLIIAWIAGPIKIG